MVIFVKLSLDKGHYISDFEDGESVKGAKVCYKIFWDWAVTKNVLLE